ncbi:MAG: hypothetical protein R3E39_20960 [Anaerolineae bacterium]
MAVAVDWLNDDQTILKYEFDGQWTWNELYAALQQVDMMMNSVEHTVYVIIDYQGSQGIPPGALTHLRSSTMRAAPNWGGGVFIGISSLVESLLNIFTNLNRKLAERYATAANIEEALSILQNWKANKATKTDQ